MVNLSSINFLVSADLLWKMLSFTDRTVGRNPNCTFSGRYKTNFLVVFFTFGMQSLNPMNPYPAISKSLVLPFTNSSSISCFLILSSLGSGSAFQNYLRWPINHLLPDEQAPPCPNTMILVSGISTLAPYRKAELVSSPGAIFLCHVSMLLTLGFSTKL